MPVFRNPFGWNSHCFCAAVAVWCHLIAPQHVAGEVTTDSVATKDGATSAAMEGARLAKASHAAVQALGPHEVQIIVTPLSQGIADKPSTRTLWVVREGEFLGKVEGRTGLHMYVRNMNRTIYNPRTNKYYNWEQPAPEPPISPEGQMKYLIDEAHWLGEITTTGLGLVTHLRTVVNEDTHLDIYLDPKTLLPVRSETVGRQTTIREDMVYKRDGSITVADLKPRVPKDAKEVPDPKDIE